MRKLRLNIPDKKQKLKLLKHKMFSCSVCGSFGAEYEGSLGHLNYDRKVFAKGNPYAQIMIIGEGPGEQEEAQLIPFVGKSGKYLDEVIRAIGYSTLRDTYITNVVLCRPPDNRDPSVLEFNACCDRLAKEILIVKPKVIITLGNVPTKRITKTSFGITTIHGQPCETEFQGHRVVFLPMYHPSYVLRRGGTNSTEHEEFLQDLALAFSFVD
jgi:DNA polymerase